MKEICICAAIKTDNGLLIRGHRHSDCFHTALRMRVDQNLAANGEQGFITSKNRFVSRRTGYNLQIKAGIASASPDGYNKGCLFSEDLY
jgi:hypothetical protein